MPVNPPYVAQGRTDHPASIFRMALAGISARPFAMGSTVPSGGVNATLGSSMAVSGLASMSVTVGTGLAYIPNSTAWSGMYACLQSSSSTVSLAASSSTQWRRDLIVATVTDPGDATAAWAPAVVTGTFSSTAPGSLPGVPANSIALGVVNVVPNMTVTNGAGTVTDARVWQPLEGPWPTTSSQRASTSAPDGTLWYEMDTNLLGVLVNGIYNYVQFSPSQPDPWHDMRPMTTGFVGSNSGEYPPQYRLTNDGLHVELFGGIGLPASGYGGVNVAQSPLPAGYRPNHHVSLPIALTSGTPAELNVLPNGNIQLAGITGSGSGVIAYLNGCTFPLDSSGLIQS